MLVSVVAVLLVAAFAMAIGAGRSGLISPHVSGELQELTVQPGTHRFAETQHFTTSGSFDERLIGIRSATPGIAVTSVSPLPARIARKGGTSVRLEFEITDCTAARNSNGIALTLRVHRFWGALSRTITQDPQNDLPENPIDTACR